MNSFSERTNFSKALAKKVGNRIKKYFITKIFILQVKD